MVSKALAQRLKLPATSVSICGVSGQKIGVARGKVILTLSPRHGAETFAVMALILPRITIYSGGSGVTKGDWEHLDGLELAGPNYRQSDPVEVLLGAEVFADILEPGLRKGRSREPVAQETRLGWILFGTVDTVDSRSRP